MQGGTSAAGEMGNLEGAAKMSATERDKAIAGHEGVEVGEHGPIFTGFRHDAQGAVAKLSEHMTGEAVAALYHHDLV